MRRFVALLFFSTLLTGCATGPPFHYYEDESGRFYKTAEGKTLRVEANGIVRMVNGKDEGGKRGALLQRPQRIVGQTTKVGEGEAWDWDMARYQVIKPTGSCNSLYGEEPAISCWNRIWEIPSLIVYVPGYILVEGVKIRLGVTRPVLEPYSRIRGEIIYDLQTCQMQVCSEQDKKSIQFRLESLAILRGLSTQRYAGQQQPLPGLQQPQQPGMIPLPDGGALFGPTTQNAYGPGIHSDATGRPFMWQPQFGGSGFPDPTLQVQPDAYGLGVGKDQYGRPVKPACPPGMVMC